MIPAAHVENQIDTRAGVVTHNAASYPTYDRVARSFGVAFATMVGRYTPELRERAILHAAIRAAAAATRRRVTIDPRTGIVIAID